MTRPDSRNKRTEQQIANALLHLLEKKPFEAVSVSELAREANVSRSTFYAHFDNVDDVFVRLVKEMNQHSQELRIQLRCDGCQERGGRQPFCVMLRESRRYHALVRDPHFLQVYLRFPESIMEGDIYADLVKDGLPQDVAQMIFRFQMSGCYMAAIETPASADWTRMRGSLDVFIRGGIAALRGQAG